MSGNAVPYSFQITYDTSLDTSAEYFATGDSLAGLTTTHEWYGYSLSGVTATTLTFGTKTWSGADIYTASYSFPYLGATDLWFDKDISIAAPARSFIAISSLDGGLQLGEVRTDASSIWMSKESQIVKIRGGGAQRILYYGTSPSMAISAVPIPAALPLMLTGLAGLRLIGRRRKGVN